MGTVKMAWIYLIDVKVRRAFTPQEKYSAVSFYAKDAILKTWHNSSQVFL
jgi:hypothetical protein